MVNKCQWCINTLTSGFLSIGPTFWSRAIHYTMTTTGWMVVKGIYHPERMNLNDNDDPVTFYLATPLSLDFSSYYTSLHDGMRDDQIYFNLWQYFEINGIYKQAKINMLTVDTRQGHLCMCTVPHRHEHVPSIPSCSLSPSCLLSCSHFLSLEHKRTRTHARTHKQKTADFTLE